APAGWWGWDGGQIPGAGRALAARLGCAGGQVPAQWRGCEGRRALAGWWGWGWVVWLRGRVTSGSVVDLSGRAGSRRAAGRVVEGLEREWAGVPLMCPGWHEVRGLGGGAGWVACTWRLSGSFRLGTWLISRTLPPPRTG